MDLDSLKLSSKSRNDKLLLTGSARLLDDFGSDAVFFVFAFHPQ